MQFGVTTMTRGPTAGRDGFIAIARKADALGFHAISCNDHVVVPGNINSPYPYSEGGRWPGQAYGECLDVLATLAFIAGNTERIRLLTSVMVVPHRPAIYTAKALATIDVLSGGRVILGCGAGWMQEEFDALGVPDFAERGRLTDEYIKAFRELWSQDKPSFDGRFVKFHDITFAPKPVQQPGIPIWIGGESGPALRRAARLGDGWYPASNNPQHRLDTPARLKDGIAVLHREVAAAKRDPASIDLGYLVQGMVDWTAQKAADGGRRIFSGSSADMAADVAAYAGLGVGHLSLSFLSNTLDETQDRMQRFAEEVMPLVH